MRETDLADELFRAPGSAPPTGVRVATARRGGVTVTRVEIAREGLERPRGRYVTLEVPRVSLLDERDESVIEPAAAELQALLRLSAQEGIRVRLLGAGTNILAPDGGVRGLVIVTSGALTGLSMPDAAHIEAMSGVTMARLACFARDNGLTGLEFAHGIPGTVGGGVFMNAGAYGGEMKQIVESVTVLTMGGEEKMLSGEESAFAYRTSVYQTLPCVIVKAVLRLQPGDPETIGQTMRTLIEKRKASQPLELPSAGSTFKRPTGYFAGPLIEQAGLKGCGVGGAEVSKKHAGFIVNTGGATAEDIKKTIAMVQSRVWETSGVRLEPEVRIW